MSPHSLCTVQEKYKCVIVHENILSYITVTVKKNILVHLWNMYFGGKKSVLWYSGKHFSNCCNHWLEIRWGLMPPEQCF